MSSAEISISEFKARDHRVTREYSLPLTVYNNTVIIGIADDAVPAAERMQAR